MPESFSQDAGGQSLLYILSDDGQHPVYNESQVQAMLAQRVLTPETLFWKEGMAEWRPLSELHPAFHAPSFVPPKRTVSSDLAPATPAWSSPSQTEQAVSPASASNSSVQIPELGAATASPIRRRPIKLYDFETNPVPLTIVTLSLMAISVGVTTFFALDCLGNLVDGTVLSHDEVATFGHYFFLLFLGHLAVEILFFFWIYYTNENCRKFTHNMTYRSGWAVGCFFVPIVNLFKPYQVMQEIWKVSESPSAWYGTRDSIFVGIWFAVRLLTYLLSRLPFHTPYADSADPAVREMGTLVHITATEACIILMQVTTFILISVITWKQVQLVRRSDKIARELTE